LQEAHREELGAQARNGVRFRHLVGYGMFLPIDQAFEMARKLYPGLKRVGVGWNPAEANSRRYTTVARQVCQKLGLETLATYGERLAAAILGGRTSVELLGWSVPARDLSMLLLALAITALTGGGLYVFFRTNLGTAMRATGDNPQMIRALGVNTGNMMIAGLALSNGLIALSGSLFAQYQGFADVQMGIGMVVWGLASVIMPARPTKFVLCKISRPGAAAQPRPGRPARQRHWESLGRSAPGLDAAHGHLAQAATLASG